MVGRPCKCRCCQRYLERRAKYPAQEVKEVSFWQYEVTCADCGEKWIDQGGMVMTTIMGPLVEKCPKCGSTKIGPTQGAVPAQIEQVATFVAPDPRDAEIAALQKQVRDQGDVIANYAKSDDIEQSEYDRMKARLCDERIAGLRIYDDVLKERTHVADLEKEAARLTAEIDKLHEIELGIMAQRDDARGELARAQAQLTRYSRAIAERDAAEEIIAPLRDEVITALKVKREAEAAFVEAAAQAERWRGN